MFYHVERSSKFNYEFANNQANPYLFTNDKKLNKAQESSTSLNKSTINQCIG